MFCCDALCWLLQHIRTKLGMHDIRKIYANVHVIESTFHVSAHRLEAPALQNLLLL